jgi:hypothetical protein
MQNTYLERLELRPGASKADIKSAYRRLSKKYHPDINKTESAQEKFLEIHEAYKFLMEVGPTPHQEQTAYDYDPYAEEYARWRERARAYARKKAAEAQKQQNELIQMVLQRFNYVAGFIFLFNIFLGIDYLLPRKEHPQRILKIEQIYEGTGARYTESNRYYKYDKMYLEDFTMQFNAGEIFSDIDGEGLVQATPIFNKPMKVQVIIDGKAHTYKQVYNIFSVFGFIIHIIFLLLLLYLFVLRTPDHKLTLAIFMIFLFLTQVFLFFRF